MLREVSLVAAARPERPAPIIMTEVLFGFGDVEEVEIGEVVESSDVKMSRRQQ